MNHHDGTPTRERPVLRALLWLPVLTIVTLPALADDWPQWRGPARNGKSAETGLLQEWPEGGPPLAWKAMGLGTGYSSVSVAGGRIFSMGDLDDGQYVLALTHDGTETRWKTRVDPVHKDQYGGPRSTPTVDGDRVYVTTTAGSVVCLEAATGKELWRRSLPDDFDGYLMKAMGSYEWKFSESPLVDGDRVVVTPGHVEALLVALNKKTGEEIWRTEGRRIGPRGADGAAYSSAVVLEAGGVRQYVQLVGRGLVGVEAATGRMLWGYNRVASDIANIATPIVDGDRVFASSGYGTGAGLVRVRKEGEDWSADEIYFLEADTMQNHHGGMVLHEGTLFTGTGQNKGLPIAVDFATGKVAWGPVRTAGQASAALSYADGRLYFRYQDGRMLLVEASPREFKERGTFMIPEVKKESWSHPVISGGKLLLREQDVLYAYDIAARGE